MKISIFKCSNTILDTVSIHVTLYNEHTMIKHYQSVNHFPLEVQLTSEDVRNVVKHIDEYVTSDFDINTFEYQLIRPDVLRRLTSTFSDSYPLDDYIKFINFDLSLKSKGE